MNINLGLHITQRAGLSPDLEAYVEPSTDTRLSYAGMNALVNRCSSVMITEGLQPGDRMALLMQNCVEFVALFYAAAKLGVVVVPLNTRLTPSELSFILSDSGAKSLFYGAECAELVAGIKANKDHPLGIESWVQARAEAGDDHRLETLLENASDAEPDIAHGGNDNLFIMYTSGTTGLPKGVVHTHETISWAALSWVTTMDVRYQDRMLLPLPMFHVAALTALIAGTVRGGTVISMPSFDPMAVWSLIRDERVTTGGSVPAILNFMRQVPDFATFESEHFRCFITGAAPMPKALIEIYNEKSMQVVQGYALTETGGGGSFLLNEYALSKIGSAGAPAMFCEMRVRDNEGNISLRGTGEVVIKAPFVMKEYWNRPEATADTFDKGWFRTGDIAEIDDDGFIFIKDRIKDMIISGGENIYPAEVENVIIAHGAVSEVAVIGLPDEKWGEIACAVVVGNEAETSEEDIIAFCAEKLSRYKLPKKVLFIDAIPRNPAGKVLKRVLRENLA
ncbi:MAG: long-chain fatty acid--CoA ligase [Pseudomonadales bacterium]|nr:long-chain fatty acid--CoA ligase [Halioglobus sp.]MCP5130461.1 long-chain fatty acid--CoA ligase [Pseudomonadales bacterium]